MKQLTGLVIATLLSALFSVAANAGEIEVKINDDTTDIEFAKTITDYLETRKPQDKLVFTKSRESTRDIMNPGRLFDYDNSYKAAYKNAYHNGDMYFMIGNLTDSWTKQEWEKFYSVSKWLVQHSFRNILNPVAYEADLAEAVQNPRTSGIVWSSHGSTDGWIYDSNNKAISHNIFSNNTGSSFKHMVMSNCEGQYVVSSYEMPKQLHYHYWNNKTTTNDLFSYLFSDKWNEDLLSDLGIQKF